MSSKTNDKDMVAGQTGAARNQKISYLLYTIIFIQGIIFYFLWFFPLGGKSSAAAPRNASEKEWRQCRKKGDEALQDGNHYQAIYFYERALRLVPEKYHKQREQINEQLATIYDKIAKHEPPSPALPAELAQTPYLLQQAQQQYHDGHYQAALPLFYQFLCQIDQDDNRKWLGLVELRIEQCKLLYGLQLGQRKPQRQQDQLLQYTLETIKK